MTFPVTAHTSNVVDTLNAYLQGRSDVPWGSFVDVPVRIGVNRQAQVLISNVTLTTPGSTVRYLRTPAGAYSTAIRN